MGVRIIERSVEGHRALEIASGNLRFVVLPELGAKILSLVDLRTGREWMARSSRPLVRREYGGRYDAYDYSGWDECFPSIGECFYPETPWRGIGVPDHGELWTLPWQTEIADSSLRQVAHGVRFPYSFERSIDFGHPGNGENQVSIDYAVTNHAPFPFQALWSAHPMLAVTPTTRFVIPEPTRVRVEVSKRQWLGGYLSEHPWPTSTDADGHEIDLSVVGDAKQDHVDKLFSTRLSRGWCAVYDEANEDFLAFTFRPDDVPFVGVCAIRGRWPTESDSTLIGLVEPCTGWPDRLDVAIDRGECVTVPAQGRRSWRLALTVGRGRAALQQVIEAAPNL